MGDSRVLKTRFKQNGEMTVTLLKEGGGNGWTFHMSASDVRRFINQLERNEPFSTHESADAYEVIA